MEETNAPKLISICSSKHFRLAFDCDSEKLKTDTDHTNQQTSSKGFGNELDIGGAIIT